MADMKISKAAEQILRAGLAAADGKTTDSALQAADKAVDDAVGQMCIDDPQGGALRVIDALREIARLHVRATIVRESGL